MSTHHLVVVPGLGGENRWFGIIVDSWEKYGFTTHICDIGWRDGERFQPKLQRLIKIIDDLRSDGNIVSLVGTSAGGSAVLNAFCDRRDKVYRVVNICGRLRAGKKVFPSLEIASRTSTSFKESVLLFEKRESCLTKKDKSKILTMRALFDEIVPASTTILPGATNIQILSIEHILSIIMAMTIYIRPMIKFLKEPHSTGPVK